LKPLVDYIENPNAVTENEARKFLSFETTKWLYTNGAENVTKISPDGYTLDQYYLDRTAMMKYNWHYSEIMGPTWHYMKRGTPTFINISRLPWLFPARMTNSF
jgi:hypothetical protein